MTETLTRLLLRRSEADEPAILWGRQAKTFLGREFDRLLDLGVLVEQALADGWDVCADCECGLDQRPIQRIGTNLVATCPLDHARDARLEAGDLRSFRVEPDAIITQIATASGFAAPPSKVLPGIWHLGKTPTNRRLFVGLRRECLLTPALIAALRAFDPKLPVTLVGPSLPAAALLRLVEAGIHFVATEDAFLPEGQAFALDLQALLPSSIVEPKLTLFRNQSKLTWDGAELDLPPISFKLLWLLAEQVVYNREVVSRQKIEEHLWATVVSKTAAADAIRNLRDALKKMDKVGTKNAKLIRTLNTQGYILDLAAANIRLID